MTVYLQDPDVTLHHGDALQTLRELPSESVHCCVTSPPFYGLRDYGTGTWEGGRRCVCGHLAENHRPSAAAPPDGGSCFVPTCNCGRYEQADCDHVTRSARNDAERGRAVRGNGPDGGGGDLYYRDVCGKCGAQRVDQQIGLEETPEQWVQALVAVFREVRRVLRPEGTLWLEVGDSYGANQGAGFNSVAFRGPGHVNRKRLGQETPIAHPYKPKDLIGAPWQLAFALRADGWYLRSDIVWARPNPMPESVTDRPTKSHSYVFLLSKQPRYFYDQEAVREVPKEWAQNGNDLKTPIYGAHRPTEGARRFEVRSFDRVCGANSRSVWQIATQPFPDAHFATFPEELARRCILAGTSERGCVVLDPFVGSGTVPYVARLHGRHSIGIDLNESYLQLAAKRLAQQSLFASVP